MHIDDLGVRHWLQERMEGTENRLELAARRAAAHPDALTDAVIFEEFIQKKFLGAKSFSLEGAESLIPLLDLAIERAGEQGVDEIVLGMAHRGRLNVLANIMGKSPREIFREFEDVDPELLLGRGDVKYHLGYSSRLDDRRRAQGAPLAVLQPEPPRVRRTRWRSGRMRAKQDRVGDAGARARHGAPDPRRRRVRRARASCRRRST